MWLIEAILGLSSKMQLWVVGAGGVTALLAALKAYMYFGKRKAGKEAVKDFTDRQVAKDIEVRKDAKRVSAKEKRETTGLSDSDVVDRLRGRTSDWERL